MLLNFTVSNFKSFKNETILNFTPAKRLKEKKNHILESKTNKAVQALPIGVIYGKNGSGKTTLIKALHFMKTRVTRNAALAVDPFRLANDEQEHTASKFSILFKYKDIVYDYGFTQYGKIIQEEWLSAYYSSKSSMLYERYYENEKSCISFGPSLIESTEKGKSYLNFIFQGIQKEQLFLREAVKRNVMSLMPVVNWFENHCYVIMPESSFNALEQLLYDHDADLQKINERIREMDLDVEHLYSTQKEFDVDTYCSQLDASKSAKFKALVETMKEDEFISFRDERTHSHIVLKKTASGYVTIKLEAGYTRADGKPVRFDIASASSGMNRMLDLFPALDLLHATDTVFIIDELERSLHTLLSQYFIKEFTEHTIESETGNQLLFSTHDTNLLDADLFRSDEIWLIEKNKENASHLCNLIEFKLTTGLNYEKGYLAGRFGAIPLFHGDTLRIR